MRDENNELPGDFLHELYKWALECMYITKMYLNVKYYKSSTHFFFWKLKLLVESIFELLIFYVLILNFFTL